MRKRIVVCSDGTWNRPEKNPGLTTEEHLKESIKPAPLAKIHNSRRSFYRVKKKYFRPIDHGCGDVIIHESVKQRCDEDSKYRPKNLVDYCDPHLRRL